jgi:hypothetical protein
MTTARMEAQVRRTGCTHFAPSKTESRKHEYTFTVLNGTLLQPRNILDDMLKYLITEEFTNAMESILP